MSRNRDLGFDFDALGIEGALLPADWLAKVAALKAPQQAAADYGVPKGLNLRDELSRYWRIAQAHWKDFDAARATGGAPQASRRLLHNLLHDVFGMADLAAATAPRVLDSREYPVSAEAAGHRIPIVIAPHDLSLDTRDRRFGDAGRQRSAFGLLQDYLNAEDAALWGLASNGLVLRLARDNSSLTRPAWIEADLERIFSEERFADFSLLWLLIHSSRFGRADDLPQHCALEAWRDASRDEGTRAREHLREGVEAALLALGGGFIAAPANTELRRRIAAGELSQQAYFGQLLRLVYRMIFLLTIEERGLLHPADADTDAVKLYAEGYGLRRLRDRARRRRAFDRNVDLWRGLKPVFAGLATGQPLLALPALGGLFAGDQCADLDTADVANAALLEAVFHLGWLRADGRLGRINWRDMGPEELGSIYESLLELVPDVSIEARTFRFAQNPEVTRGNARKTSGSYYTPDPLVQELLDSALDPIIAQRLAGADDAEAALLAITVCDPACGSGHFLLAAARRLANRLAQLRAEGTPSGADYRHALRDVIGHCVYGVDMNPMALELARMSLWLEAMTPDKPLGFLDHHLQCGDALLGVLDLSIFNRGIPDDAFKPLTGDDKAVAAAQKKQNKLEYLSWRQALATDDLFRAEQLAAAGTALERLADDDLAAIAAKRAAWRQAEDAAQASRLARMADLYVGAFLLPKLPATQAAMPSSRHLWALANRETAPGLADAETAARSACLNARVFHWWLAFPQIAAAGGFAVMLGNPPWERIKLQEQEFFAAKNPQIAEARNKAERGQRIQWLSEGMLAVHLHPDLQPSPAQAKAEQNLYAEFTVARRTAEASSAFAHVSTGRYPLTGVGDVNTYALFAETFAQLVAGNGRAGVIVPTGIATDDSTKAYFGAIAGGGRLASLRDFENSEGVFPGVHRSYKFSLLTLGCAEAADFVCFATQVAQLADPRRKFTLTPAEFALINPNTRTCPVFRSARDAELTKAIYRRVPVLIREAVPAVAGKPVEPEVNPWGIRFQTIFHMSNDSGLFQNAPGADTLPLYEAKMIHQFDHRWATYVPDGEGKLETVDCTDAQKTDPAFRVAPRYWVDRHEVLARIARVPRGVANGWLAAHTSADANARVKALADLWLALAQWVAGELFRREVAAAAGATDAKARYARAARQVESRLAAEFPACANALRVAKITARKADTEFPKWAARDVATPLADDELAVLRRFAGEADAAKRDAALLAELDGWMDRLSPRWLMGWRRNARSTDERTTIATVMPRTAQGDSVFLYATSPTLDARANAALLANLNCLALDFIARQKVGGMNYSFYYFKQLPILPPDRYTAADLDFIVPRVLELTYTAHDLADWARDLGHAGAPFAWDPDRRAQLRAELDAYYARLYGVTRDELRYILDPADVEGPDYPSETFRVLQKKEIDAFGEYRTRRLVLAAWDAMEQGGAA